MLKQLLLLTFSFFVSLNVLCDRLFDHEFEQKDRFKIGKAVKRNDFAQVQRLLLQNPSRATTGLVASWGPRQDGATRPASVRTIAAYARQFRYSEIENLILLFQENKNQILRNKNRC